LAFISVCTTFVAVNRKSNYQKRRIKHVFHWYHHRRDDLSHHWHPIVIKTEYYWGTRPWILYLLVGICCCVAALFVANVYISSFLGVFRASALWGIGELFEQKKRVEKGWFPKNPKRL